MPRYSHICKDLEERGSDNTFEYCKSCGAKWHMNRKPQPDKNIRVDLVCTE